MQGVWNLVDTCHEAPASLAKCAICFDKKRKNHVSYFRATGVQRASRASISNHFRVATRAEPFVSIDLNSLVGSVTADLEVAQSMRACL